ncbi:precorrin-6A/cobalt-precorrin-6A reductase [Geminicoccaceae bacterium 1502E]|nr:precorrin-6A/cobalt-precorrin-6A reductase [Geminicoccaceae bacterium 1502E]
MPPRVLVLGGTPEAATVTAGLRARRLAQPVGSLPSPEPAPAPPPGTLLVGDEGGTQRLARYLALHRIAALVDATHPFAMRLAAGAAAACRLAGVPRFKVERAPWPPLAGAPPLEVDSVEEGVRLLPSSARRVLAAVGRRDLACLAGAAPVRFVIRTPDRPPPLPGNVLWLWGQPSCDAAVEAAFLGTLGIDALLLRETGGGEGFGKLLAARLLARPVVMIRRPTPPSGPRGTPAECLAWLGRLLEDRDGHEQALLHGWNMNP